MDISSYQTIYKSLNFSRPASRVFRHLALDAVLISSAVWFHGRLPLLWTLITVSLLIATVMFRAFSMMHEAVHGSLVTNRSLNLALGRCFGVLCGLPFDSWRKIHLDHHLWTGNLDKDPTMSIMRAHRDGEVKVSRLQEFCWRWWLPYLAWRQQIVFWKKSYQTTASQKTLLLQASVTLAVAGLLVFGFGLATFVGAFFTYCLLIEVVNFPHHMDLRQKGGSHRLTPALQHQFTRTCLYFGWLEKYVLLNFNYHVEHHLFPTLPWFRLPTAHQALRAELGERYHLSVNSKWFKESRRATLNEMLDRCAEPVSSYTKSA